jgi:hypothetical protein
MKVAEHCPPVRTCLIDERLQQVRQQRHGWRDQQRMVTVAAQSLSLSSGRHPARCSQGQKDLLVSTPRSARAISFVRWFVRRASDLAIRTSAPVGFTVSKAINSLILTTAFF